VTGRRYRGGSKATALATASGNRPGGATPGQRRRWLAAALAAVVASACATAACTAAQPSAARPNVLLIMADDLRDHGRAFGKDVVKTPNLDRLAARGVRFSRACAQYPVCNPSRTSLLLGRRCEETRVVDNRQFFRDVLPDAVTFPELLRRHGWTTMSFGKVLHTGNTGEAARASWLDEGRSWDHAETLPASSPHRRGEFRNLTGGVLPWCEIGILDGDDDEQPDGRTAAACVRAIEDCTASGGPWLIAAGFHRPHDPFHVPRRYFDLVPAESLTVAADANADGRLPPLAIPAGWRREFAAFTRDERLDFLRAYLAGVSFMDAQVGRLLDALDHHQLWSTTVVIFLGDHGYHLGECGWWNKNTLFDRSCRAPLIIAAPDAKHGGECHAPVEFVDLYPTVVDYCGLQPPEGLAGLSLRPALVDPTTRHKEAAFTLVVRDKGQHGRSVLTDRWRMTSWSDGTRELYDHRSDPEETENLAGRATLTAVQEHLSGLLRSLPPWPPSGPR
jgi:iduronate 2-sulfatase